MIVDSSALIHILFHEPGAEDTVDFLTRQPELDMAAPTLLETEIVYGARRGFSRGDVAELVDRLGIATVPFGRDHAREAKLAYSIYGKGQGHRAQLNFGDCITYAVAKLSGKPVVFQGDDFNHTDLESRRIGERSST